MRLVELREFIPEAQRAVERGVVPDPPQSAVPDDPRLPMHRRRAKHGIGSTARPAEYAPDAPLAVWSAPRLMRRALQKRITTDAGTPLDRLGSQRRELSQRRLLGLPRWDVRRGLVREYQPISEWTLDMENGTRGAEPSRVPGWLVAVKDSDPRCNSCLQLPPGMIRVPTCIWPNAATARSAGPCARRRCRPGCAGRIGTDPAAHDADRARRPDCRPRRRTSFGTSSAYYAGRDWKGSACLRN